MSITGPDGRTDGPYAGTPELLGLLAGACLAAKQQHWHEPLRTRT